MVIILRPEDLIRKGEGLLGNMRPIEDVELTDRACQHLTPELLGEAELVLFLPVDSPLMKVLKSKNAPDTEGLIYHRSASSLRTIISLGPRTLRGYRTAIEVGEEAQRD